MIGHSVLLVILTDVAGAERDRAELDLASDAPEAVLDQIAATIAAMLERQQVARQRVWGVGLVIPALFQDDRLVVLGEVALPGWKDFPLRQSLQDRLGLPVLLENDATAAAIGDPRRRASPARIGGARRSDRAATAQRQPQQGGRYAAPDRRRDGAAYPYVVVRFRCHVCERGGDARLAVLAAMLGPGAQIDHDL